MNTTTLFGLALGPLYAAIAQVESTGGKYSPNVYQIDAHVPCGSGGRPKVEGATKEGGNSTVQPATSNLQPDSQPATSNLQPHGYVADVNRICERMCRISGTAFRPFPPEAKFDRRASERMMAVYWQHWGAEYEKKTGERVTYEVLARIHNGGPLGWKKRETRRYWQRVKDALEELTEDR